MVVHYVSYCAAKLFLFLSKIPYAIQTPAFDSDGHCCKQISFFKHFCHCLSSEAIKFHHCPHITMQFTFFICFGIHLNCVYIYTKQMHSFVWNGYVWLVQQKRTSNGKCLCSHSVAFPRTLVIEQTSKYICSAPMTVCRFVCSHSHCVDAR